MMLPTRQSARAPGQLPSTPTAPSRMQMAAQNGVQVNPNAMAQAPGVAAARPTLNAPGAFGAAANTLFRAGSQQGNPLGAPSPTPMKAPGAIAPAAGGRGAGPVRSNLQPGVGTQNADTTPTQGNPQGAQQDPHIEQLYNDMLSLNQQARGDIEKAGQDRFGAMQRAAMAASSRYGGGVGGAVLSTQGDMLRQATAGMADALQQNTGQHMSIMGNYMSGLWGDQRMNTQHGWDLDQQLAGADAEKQGLQGEQTQNRAHDTIFADVLKQTNIDLNDPAQRAKDPQLFDLASRAASGDPQAQQDLQAHLGQRNADYQHTQAQSAWDAEVKQYEKDGVPHSEAIKIVAKKRGARP